MRKTVKHAHTHGHKHTPQHCPGVHGAVNFFYFYFVSTLQLFTVLGFVVWVHAGNICAFRGLTHPPQQGGTWAGFICVPTWSFLDLWGLVKGSNGRNTERALSTAAQLWLSVVSAHSLFPHFIDCVYLWHTWIQTVTFGWLTLAGLWECGF